MATSGVGLLSQVLGSTLDANRRNAMWRAEQEQQNEQAQAQREAAQQHLAAQLRANLFGQLLSEQNKNIALAQSEERYASRERDAERRAAAALERQSAIQAARAKSQADLLEREWELRGAEGEKARAAAKEIAGIRAKAMGQPRVSIQERRGGFAGAGGGQQEDFRKTQEAFEADKITRVYLAQIGAAASMPAQQRVMAEAEAKRQFDDRMEKLRSRRSTGPVAPAAPPVVEIPELLRRPMEQMDVEFDPADPFR